jgi:hypothetical protein
LFSGRIGIAASTFDRVRSQLYDLFGHCDKQCRCIVAWIVRKRPSIYHAILPISESSALMQLGMVEQVCVSVRFCYEVHIYSKISKIASARRTRATALQTDCGVTPVSRAASAGRNPFTSTKRAAAWAAPPRIRMRRARASNFC